MKTLPTLIFLSLAASLFAAPSYYQKQGTWQETVRLSREALVQRKADEAVARAAGQKPLNIEIDAGQPVVNVGFRVILEAAH